MINFFIIFISTSVLNAQNFQIPLNAPSIDPIQ